MTDLNYLAVNIQDRILMSLSWYVDMLNELPSYIHFSEASYSKWILANSRTDDVRLFSLRTYQLDVLES